MTVMTDIRIVPSLVGIDKGDWNACFEAQLEDYDYLLSVEQSGIVGFQWCYVMAYSNGLLQAAIPAFLTDYAIDTTLDGAGKKVAAILRSMRPNMLTFKLACLGSPVTEYGRMGFHPHLDDGKKPAIIADMMAAFERHALAHHHRLIGIKDIPSFQEPLWEFAMSRHGYRSTRGLPVASLPIRFSSMDEYFASLSSGTRKDMRRKWRSRHVVRIEQRHLIDDVLPQMMALYRNTRMRSAMQFEELNEAYFENILRTMPHAFCNLYYLDDTLIGFNLLIESKETLLDKFFCMDASLGREHNLYFISWLANTEYCILRGIGEYQSGQAGYQAKLRLGSTLVSTAMVFKHRNRIIHGALRIAAPLLAADDDVHEAA